MPKIDFYILSENDPTARLQLACRLIEKAYKNRHRVYIHTHDQTDAHALDELLWTYRDDSFIPHNLYGEGPEPTPPIQIGFNVIPDKHRDILINLSVEIPPFYKQFSRVFELIQNDVEKQAKARENYKLYRLEGCEMTTHKLQTVSS